MWNCDFGGVAGRAGDADHLNTLRHPIAIPERHLFARSGRTEAEIHVAVPGFSVVAAIARTLRIVTRIEADLDTVLLPRQTLLHGHDLVVEHVDGNIDSASVVAQLERVSSVRGTGPGVFASNLPRPNRL